jgi:hypothetical protein
MSILSVFSQEHPVLGLAEISRRTGLSSSTTHRLVTELTDWGALARTSDLRYRIGPTLRRLGAASPGAVNQALTADGVNSQQPNKGASATHILAGQEHPSATQHAAIKADVKAPG